jgi:H+-transporting ATPase
VGLLTDGLTSSEARAWLIRYGPNVVPQERMRPWARLLAKVWAPVPWMLEAAIVLQLVLGEWIEAAVIAVLA